MHAAPCGPVQLSASRPVQTTSTWIFLASLILLPLATACGTGARDGEEGTDILDLHQLRLVGPEVRIGSLDDPDFAFTDVTRLDALPDGTILSFHRQEQMIRRWTPDGQPDGSIGRQGQGPGEFENVFLMGVFGDTVWAFDFQAYRTTRFTSDGQLLGTSSLTVELGERGTAATDLPARPGRPFRDGTYVGSVPGFSHAIATGEFTHSNWVRFADDGSIMGTIWQQEYRTRDVLALLRETGGSYGRQPFGDQTLVNAVDDGVVIVDRRTPDSAADAAIRVTRIGVAGDTLFHTALPFTPVALPQERVDSAVTAQAESMLAFQQRFDEGMTLPALRADLAAATYVPAWSPVVDAALVTDTGEIWIRKFEPHAEGRAWWVLSPYGDPRGTVVTPSGLQILAIREGMVYGVERDEFDVNYIVRYAVRALGS